MDTGQIMAVMQRMPASLAVPQSGEVDVPVDQGGGAFAGVLQGISVPKSVQTAPAKQAVALSGSGAGRTIKTAPEMTNDVMTAFLATAGNNEKQATHAQDDPTGMQSVASSLQDTTDPSSQNVMLDVNGAQSTLLAQLYGRMPGAGIITDSRSEGQREIPPADRGVTAAPDSDVLAQIRRDAPQQQTATNAISSPEGGMHPDGTTAIPTQIPVLATIAAGKDPMLTRPAGIKAATPSPIETTVTEGDRQAAMKSAEVPRPADATPLVSAENRGRQTVDSFAQVWDSLGVVIESQRQHDSLQTRSPEIVAEPVVPAKATLQEPVAVVHASGTDGVPHVEQQITPVRVATLAPTPAATGPENGPTEAPQQPGTSGQQEQLQKVRTATPPDSLSAAVVTAADGRPETVALRADQRETGKALQNERVDTAKTVAAVSSGEKQTGSDKNESTDRDMSGNFQSQLLHQQVKTEGPLTASTTAGAVQNDASRAAPAPEQVVQQVRDRLVNHDTKPGSEQIVLRLSPEHLGDLKVNLNLEGQRLKVEIVAENRMVRDSLMQHTDALKESLSRQNIKMDSFEVTTGGNGTTDGGRGQGEWRELAQQRQQNTWMPDGGYRLAKEAAPAIAAYQVKSEHTMVDLHF